MNTQTRNYAIRLSAEGKRQLEQDLRSLGVSGQRSLKLIQQAGTPASQGLKKTDKAAKDLKGTLHAVGQEVPALQRLVRFLGPTAVAGAMAALARSSLDVGRQFEAAMKRVAAATQGAEADVLRLRDAAMETGATTAFTAMEAAGAIETLAKNGVDVEAILAGALTASVRLAGSLGGDLARSADLVTDVMAQFKLEASELPLIADRITGAALTSKFGFDDLRLAIGQAGGVAGSFGVDVEDFLTALSATSSSFASGSDAGTSFKNFLQRLTPQSKEAQAAIEALNLEFFTADGSMRSLAEIAGELEDGVAGLNQEARNSAFQKIFGTDAVRTALSLAGLGADGFSDLAESLREVSAEEQAQVRLEGLDGALKELTASWEALQLEAAENGGLDLAEESVDRFTAALRYLSENFQEVEEIAERVAQALVVVLVGKGLTLATAKAIAMRTAYLSLAASVTSVGVASTGALPAMTRLTMAGRVMTGVLGGPIGLAVTAASIVALGLDADRAADRIGNADAAAKGATDALDRFREASNRAAREQQGLSEAVSGATSKLVEQTRFQLQEALRELQSAQSELLGDMLGQGFFDKSQLDDTINAIATELRSIETTGLGNELLDEVLSGLKAFRLGEGDIAAVADAYERILGVGSEAQAVVNEFDAAAGSGNGLRDAASRMVQYAESIGLAGAELRELERYEPFSREWFSALRAVRGRLLEAEEAAKVLREQTAEGFVDMALQAAKTETEIEKVKNALVGVFEASDGASEENGLTQIEEDARGAREEIERLDRAYASYLQRQELGSGSTDRGGWLRAAGTAASRGVLDLLGYAEGTDRGRGYNETLDYGAYTGGPVNLINMTLREVLALQREMLRHPDNPHNSSAVGRYQIVGTTLGGRGLTGAGGLIQQLGLSLDEKFTPRLQDRLAMELVRQSGMTTEGMRATWEGLIHVPGSTINSALSGQVVPSQDKETAAAAETRRRMREQEAEALARLVALGDEQVAQLQLEAQLVGKSAAEQARLTAMYEMLTAAKRAGIDPEKQLTKDGELLIDVFRRQADALAERATEQALVNQTTQTDIGQLHEAKDAMRSAFDNFRADGEGLKGFFGDTFDYIAQKLWELAWDPVWEDLARGLSGLLGGSGAGVVGAVLGTPAAGDGGPIPRLASGGPPPFSGPVVGQGGRRQDNILLWGSVGEFMQPASAVDYYGHDFMEAVRQRRFPRLADGGSLGAVNGPGVGVGVARAAMPNITYAPVIHAPGADSATVAKLQVQQDAMMANFEQMVFQSVRNGENRGYLKRWTAK